MPPTAADLDALCASPRWEGSPPPLSVVIPTYRRPQFLAELAGRLEAQNHPLAEFEVVVVDNGSGDTTWPALQALARVTPLRLKAARLATNQGPGAARSVGVALARGDLLVFTDDDCLPEPGWLGALWEAAAVADVVQGRTMAAEEGRPAAGVWARSVWVDGLTGLFETCNIAYRRGAFEAAGGFDLADGLSSRAGSRAFGEDALLGARAVAAGARAVFAPGALVRHRYVPGGYLEWLRELRNLVDMPGVIRRSPLAAEACWHRAFLDRHSAAFDLAALAILAAALRRSPRALLGGLPWLLVRLPELAHRAGGRPRALRIPQVFLADAVALASLVQGSVRHRRVLL